VNDSTKSNEILGAVVVSCRWLFAPPLRPGGWRSISWWELRRVPVNLLIGSYGEEWQVMDKW
jgi:hypothetical protein